MHLLVLQGWEGPEEGARGFERHTAHQQQLPCRMNICQVRYAYFVSNHSVYCPQLYSKMEKKQKKNSHGALTCNNSNCPAVLAGYTTLNRDAVGATGIGLAVVTTIFSSDKKLLPPYNPSASTTTTATTTSHFELDQIYRLVSPSSTFLHGAGQTSM
ncbi:hypothetical protein BDA99DRAFT_529080 [Phascolomyces articulosus]|uniref:Uncharacterized protein n=1 Tax=Phascolomyces articulosus TaxID=60185 RepID=A0AAD5JZP2_9FUNG|nr:hypothetical protein BDA99DRAFT_529080 [Phascolomyces articulosus]